MITMSELLKGNKLEDQSEKVQYNLLVLCDRINAIREAYAKPMVVTSGLRTMEDHLRIYSEKGITDQSKIPMKSKHLFGQAVDIADQTGLLKVFINNNIPLLAENSLWCEDFHSTPGWCHFQTVPYGSWVDGKERFFKP